MRISNSSTLISSLMLLFVISNLSAVVNIPEIHKTEQSPVIDGKLDDQAWTGANTFTGFKTFEPDYGKEPHGKTVVYVMYDRDNFYFAFRCSDPNPKLIKATETDRDNMFGDDWRNQRYRLMLLIYQE